jgi:uncharacterized protein
LERTPGSGKDHIGYNALMLASQQAAVRGVIRASLDKVARMGHLPSDHHFYVTFRTRMQGVQMDDSLKDRFPDEMTIVIQHQYSDFKVFDTRFEIVLQFGGRPQLLRIPFGAVTRFVDPSVNFGVEVDPIDVRADETAPAILPAQLSASGGATPPVAPAEPPEGTVVSLDAFRRK